VPPIRVVVVSDSHLSPVSRPSHTNWDTIVAHVAAARPDTVIHLGDLSLLGNEDPEELGLARTQLERLAAPWRVVPGNHDLGDNPLAEQPAAWAIGPERRRRWVDTFGDDWWSLDAGEWTLLAVNAQLFASGLDAEAAQWQWLEDQLASLDPQRPLGLLSHKPLTAPESELAGAPHRFVPAAARDRLADLAGHRIRLVLSGHVHQARHLASDGCDHVWVPTTWAVIPDREQPRFGAKRCGALELELTPAAASWRWVEPAGIRQLTLGENVADPYHP
jgi:3',5'-cyclic AMP phosphodiesterase CpdA